MTQVYILYWEPGSGGDLVQNLLLRLPNWSGVVDQFSLTDDGRTNPKFKKEFTDKFSYIPLNWYKRLWSDDDCKLLETIVSNEATDYFIIPTHLPEQVEFLKLRLASSKTIGITYSSELFLSVLKNWCKKVAATDPEICKIYNSNFHKALRDNGVFGEFVLSEQLKFGTTIRKFVDNNFDTTVSLEDLYAGDLHSLKDFLNADNSILNYYNKWLKKQNPLHCYTYNIHPKLKQALGNNTKATQPGNQNLELDIYDNILIKHYLTTQTPKFKTLQEANIFFTSLTF